MNVAQLQLGHRVTLPQAMAALQLISAFGHSPMAGLVDLRSLDVSAPGVVVVTTGQGGEITFGLDDLEQQLWRWRGLRQGQERERDNHVNGSAVSNSIPVHAMAPGAAPDVAPKNSTPA